MPEYTGSISGVNICLLKGEYRIKNIVVHKIGTRDSVPLFTAPAIDLSVQWSALKEMRIVGEIDVYNPKVSFVLYDADPDSGKSQTGTEIEWTEPIKELMPLEINRFEIFDGSVHYVDPAQSPTIDIYATNLNIQAKNLSNATDQNVALPSTLDATGSSIGGGKMTLKSKVNFLKEIPDFDYDFKFEGIDITSLNDFADAYAALDFEGGNLDLYSEMALNDGNIDGYFKPVLTNIDLIDFSEDIKNPLKLIWESFAALILEIFENQGEDQFATKVPLSGSIDKTQTEIWPTVLNILRNAFVEAFKKQPDDTIEFENVSDDTEKE